MPFTFSERTLTLRKTAYERLNITPAQVPCAPQITPEISAITATIKRAGQSRTIRRRTLINQNDSTERVASDILVDEHSLPYGPGSDLKSAWPTYLQGSEHADARKVLLAYHSLPIALRRPCPIEAFCVAASVSPLSILTILVSEIVRRGAQARTVVAMLNQPRMVQKMVEVGLTDEGFSDRELLAKATGFLPAAKGAQTIVNVAATASAESSPVVAITAPPPERTIRRLVDRFNEAAPKSLPAAPANNIPAADARELVMVDDEESD
jgi:hypothetical protein